MSTKLVAVLSLLLRLCSASIVRVPLVADEPVKAILEKRDFNIDPKYEKVEALIRDQHLLGKQHESSSDVQVPVEDPFRYGPSYFINIGVGTPPQHVKVAVDISGADTFVLSANCTRCTPDFYGYNFSTSSTAHRKSKDTHRPNRFAFNVEGQLTEDTIEIGGMTVEQQTFTDSWLLDPIGISYNDWSILQGILTLAPGITSETSKADSPLVNMAHQELLNRNVFSLRLRSPAELAFGGIDDSQYMGELKKVPLTDRESPFFLSGSWQTPVSHLVLGDDPGVKFELQGRTASFQTLDPFIRLPNDIAWRLVDGLGFEDSFMLPPSVPCSKRDALPNLTFNLSGHNFTLTPYDWTMEWVFENGKSRCVSAVFPTGLPDYVSTEIIFGTAFMRAFYSVFDLDEKTIGFAKLAK